MTPDRSLIGTRVKVTTARLEAVGRLDAWPTSDGHVLVFCRRGDKGWMQIRVPQDEVVSLEPAPLVCGVCGAHALTLYGDLCAECTREKAKKDNIVRQLTEGCEECGTVPAVWHAKVQQWLCTTCGPAVEREALTAACAGKDVHDPSHDWKRAKSSHVCRRCKMKTFEVPKGVNSEW